jgi:prepilin-type N-terminal cleavage/methylation domain-containing protein
MSARDAVGFTLVELMAALAITGLALAGGIRLLDQIGDSAMRIRQENLRSMARANGERVLRRALLDAIATGDSATRFAGTRYTIALSSSCDAPGGWIERCRASLSLDQRGDSSVVLGTLQPGVLATGELLVLRRQRGHTEWRYLGPSPSESTWVSEWTSHVAVPIAVALVGVDTIVFPVGTVRD